jgi:hypothetical protein
MPRSLVAKMLAAGALGRSESHRWQALRKINARKFRNYRYMEQAYGR